MTLLRRSLLAGLAIPAAGVPYAARAQALPMRIGVLTALSGAYQDGAGQGSVLAARMAAEDAGIAVDILAGDMLDKPDVGLSVARAWFDRDGVDAIVDVPNSAIALAVAGLVRERNKLALFTGPGAAVLSGAACSPNHLQWTYDTGALARTTGRAVLAAGGRRWFFITADYAFGHALQADTAREVVAGGGEVVGSAAFPFPETTDFAAFLLQAQASGADVIGLACTGAHLNTVVKQAAEFRLGLRLAALICLVTSVRAIGLTDAQGMVLSLPFYWDLTPATRAFAGRFAAQYGGVMPTMTQAGTYTAVLHYLRAAAGVRDGAAAVARMKALPVTDRLFTGTVIRATGSVAHDMHLFTVKAPGEQRYPWDYLRDERLIPAAEAFGPAQSACAGF
jgi:branched-chain amino acid transport system substrate-binding protein